jgi:hypothetical protein
MTKYTYLDLMIDLKKAVYCVVTMKLLKYSYQQCDSYGVLGKG